MTGTRFRIFPKPYEGYEEPETVLIDLPAGSIGPGPSDGAIHVVNAIGKTDPYDPGFYLPPFDGAVFAPAQPDASGHFDRIAVGTPQFRAAHIYAVVRLTVQLWQRYLGRPIVWWFAHEYPSLELVPLVAWDNAQSGFGYLETGAVTNRFGQLDEFWLNLDVIAHETGHITLFSTIGVPEPASVHGAFLAFHEAFADLFAVTGALQFRSVRERLLAETAGNLYVENVVSRVGELSAWTQIQSASNTVVMADVADLTLAADGSWIDPRGLGRGVFDLSAPLIGAIFDILVELYQDGLVSRGLIPEDMGPAAGTRAEVEASLAAIRLHSGRAYARFAAGFEASLDDARDLVCRCMAHVMHRVRPETLTFDSVAARFLDGASLAGLERLMPVLLGHFMMRGIDPRAEMGRDLPVPLPPAVRRPGRPSPPAPAAVRPHCRSCGRPDAFLLAGRLLDRAHRVRGFVYVPDN